MICQCYAMEDHNAFTLEKCKCQCHSRPKITFYDLGLEKNMEMCTLAEDVGQLHKQIRELDQDLGRAIERIEALEYHNKIAGMANSHPYAGIAEQPRATKVADNVLSLDCPYCKGHGKVSVYTPEI